MNRIFVNGVPVSGVQYMRHSENIYFSIDGFPDTKQLTALIDAVLDSLATGGLAASLDAAVQPFIPYSSAPDTN